MALKTAGGVREGPRAPPSRLDGNVATTSDPDDVEAEPFNEATVLGDDGNVVGHRGCSDPGIVHAHLRLRIPKGDS